MPSSPEPLKEEDTREILTSVGQGMVSIYAPMQPSGSGVRQNRLRWKTISTELQLRLEKRELESDLITQIMHQVDSLVDARQFWLEQSLGLACFVTRDECRCIQLTRRPEQSLSIDKRFNVRPLLPEINRDFCFYVVTNEQERWRLFQVNGENSKELSEELPESFSRAMDCRQLEESQMQGIQDRLSGARDQDSAPLPNKSTFSNELSRFLRGRSSPPLFFAGPDDKFKSFAQVTDYDNFQNQRIRWDSSSPSWKRVIREGQLRVAASRKEKIERMLETFDAWQDSDWATGELPEIYRGAITGQIKNLIVADEFNCFGNCPDGGEPDFANSKGHWQTEGDEDFANLLISKTIQNGGIVYSAPSRVMPSQASAIALFGETDVLNR